MSISHESKHIKGKNKNFLSDALMTLLYASFTVLNTNSVGVFFMIIVIIAIIIINYDSTNKKFKLHFGLFSAYITLFTLFCLISTLWALKSGYAIEKTYTLLSILMCYTILYSIYYDVKVERLIKCIMYGGILVSFYSIMFYGLNNIQNTLSSESRLDTEFANVNVIGSVCGTSIILAYYYFRKNKDYVLLLSCIPGILVVAGTGSKKALIMLIIGLIFIQILYASKDKGKSGKRVKILGSFLGILIIIFLLAKSGVFLGTMSRMDGLIASITGQGEVDSSTALRSLYRALGYAQFLRTPILGIGMGNARILAYKATGHDAYLHDNFAEMLANGGIIGFILYYWIYYYIFRVEYRYRKVDKLASIILFLVIINLVMDLGAVSYYNKSTYFILMIEMLHLSKLKRTYKHG